MFTFSSQPSIAAFYDGKTITVIVAAGAGGGLTRSCQAFVNFMPKHIAGNPKMIIKNMPGAGGTIGLNYLADKARPDGLTIFWGPTNFTALLIDMPGTRYDPGKFQLIGAGDTTYVTLMRSDTPPGIKKPADLLKASGFKVGGRSPVSGLDLFSRMPLAILGTKYIYVPGYTAQPKMNAAIRAKEIQYLTTGHQGYRAFYENTLLKTGEATALYYHSPLDAQGKPGKVDRYPSNIKQFVNFYKDIYGKMPSGPMWEAYKWMSTYVIWPFLMVTPEGVPKEAVSELRKAHVATTKDPEYQKAYLKAYGVMPTWLTGEEGQWLLKNYKNISPEGLEGLKQLTKTKKKK
jgi:tripartite-type tricarboxylate transporter receptor subunit TctC